MKKRHTEVGLVQEYTQREFTCSKSIMETPEPKVASIQS